MQIVIFISEVLQMAIFGLFDRSVFQPLAVWWEGGVPLEVASEEQEEGFPARDHNMCHTAVSGGALTDVTDREGAQPSVLMFSILVNIGLGVIFFNHWNILFC